MFTFLVLLTLVVFLLHIYPLGVLHWIDQFDAFLEERYQQRQERYFREVHERITAMRMELGKSDLDPLTRTRLQRMCDDYERDLRIKVLNAEDE